MKQTITRTRVTDAKVNVIKQETWLESRLQTFNQFLPLFNASKQLQWSIIEWGTRVFDRIVFGIVTSYRLFPQANSWKHIKFSYGSVSLLLNEYIFRRLGNGLLLPIQSRIFSVASPKLINPLTNLQMTNLCATRVKVPPQWTTACKTAKQWRAPPQKQNVVNSQQSWWLETIRSWSTGKDAVQKKPARKQTICSGKRVVLAGVNATSAAVGEICVMLASYLLPAFCWCWSAHLCPLWTCNEMHSGNNRKTFLTVTIFCNKAGSYRFLYREDTASFSSNHDFCECLRHVFTNIECC